MVTYRYSEDGIASLVRKATRQFLIITSIASLVGFAVVWVNGELPDRLSEIVTGSILGASVFWAWRRSLRNIRTIAKSTEFELDEDTLAGRNSLATTKLARSEVTEMRYMKDGILVRGANLRHMIQVKPELEGFQELATRIEDWVPADVRRTRASSSLGFWVTSAAIGNLGLLFIAFSATTSAVAIPCCILEAVFLIGCAVFTWRSKTVAPRLKWMMLIVTLPTISLIGRAYLLSQSR
jgi:hypothetical protein